MTQTNENNARLAVGRRAGIVGICANVLLFAFKLFVGLLTSSVAIVADAVNNLSDAGSSVFVLVGYAMSGKPADKKHPYGHARIEYLCGLFISVIITVLGIELLRSGVQQLFSGTGGAQFGKLTFIVMGVAVAVKLIMALFYRLSAKKIDSQALRASSVDSMGDAAASMAVMAGMLLSKYTGPLTDAVLGCAIAVYIIVMGIKLVYEASDTLIGKAPDADFVAGIAEKIRSYDGVIGIHDLVVHSYGAGRCFVSAHVEVDAERDIMQSHDLVDNIEDDFRRERGIQLVIHMDPVQCSDPRVSAVKAQTADILSQISAEYSSPASMHDFRVVFGVTHSNLIFDVAVTDEFPLSDEKLCEVLNAEVKKLDPAYNAVITVDRDYCTERFGKKM